MKTRNRKTKEQPVKDCLFNFRLNFDLKEQYDEFCIKNGYSIGKRLRSLMKADLDGKIKLYI